MKFTHYKNWSHLKVVTSTLRSQISLRMVLMLIAY